MGQEQKKNVYKYTSNSVFISMGDAIETFMGSLVGNREDSKPTVDVQTILECFVLPDEIKAGALRHDLVEKYARWMVHHSVCNAFVTKDGITCAGTIMRVTESTPISVKVTYQGFMINSSDGTPVSPKYDLSLDITLNLSSNLVAGGRSVPTGEWSIKGSMTPSDVEGFTHAPYLDVRYFIESYADFLFIGSPNIEQLDSCGKASRHLTFRMSSQLEDNWYTEESPILFNIKDQWHKAVVERLGGVSTATLFTISVTETGQNASREFKGVRIKLGLGQVLRCELHISVTSGLHGWNMTSTWTSLAATSSAPPPKLKVKDSGPDTARVMTDIAETRTMLIASESRKIVETFTDFIRSADHNTSPATQTRLCTSGSRGNSIYQIAYSRWAEADAGIISNDCFRAVSEQIVGTKFKTDISRIFKDQGNMVAPTCDITVKSSNITLQWGSSMEFKISVSEDSKSIKLGAYKYGITCIVTIGSPVSVQSLSTSSITTQSVITIGTTWGASTFQKMATASQWVTVSNPHDTPFFKGGENYRSSKQGRVIEPHVFELHLDTRLSTSASHHHQSIGLLTLY